MRRVTSLSGVLSRFRIWISSASRRACTLMIFEASARDSTDEKLCWVDKQRRKRGQVEERYRHWTGCVCLFCSCFCVCSVYSPNNRNQLAKLTTVEQIVPRREPHSSNKSLSFFFFTAPAVLALRNIATPVYFRRSKRLRNLDTEKRSDE